MERGIWDGEFSSINGVLGWDHPPRRCGDLDEFGGWVHAVCESYGGHDAEDFDGFVLALERHRSPGFDAETIDREIVLGGGGDQDSAVVGLAVFGAAFEARGCIDRIANDAVLHPVFAAETPDDDSACAKSYPHSHGAKSAPGPVLIELG